jgi:hypothetical protein
VGAPVVAPAAPEPPAASPVLNTPATASRTIQEPPDPDTAPAPLGPYDGIVSDLTIQEIRAADALLASLPQDRLLRFLRERKLIEAKGDYHSLSPQYVRRILTDPEGFKIAVEG